MEVNKDFVFVVTRSFDYSEEDHDSKVVAVFTSFLGASKFCEFKNKYLKDCHVRYEFESFPLLNYGNTCL